MATRLRNNKVATNDAMREAVLRAGLNVDAPSSAVDALIEDVLGPRAALLGKRKKHPSRKNPAEKEEADENPARHHNTLNQIARILHCEGFDEFSGLGVLHYGKRLFGKEWFENAQDLRAGMAIPTSGLSPEHKKTIGQFIHQQSKASFDAGLRIGLMTSLQVIALLYERDASR